MSDCILAYQQCRLIGLDDSPDLLRQSMLQADGSKDLLLWDSKEATHAGVVQRLAFTPAAAVRNSSASILAQAVAACEMSLKGVGSSILDCSLPLFSESPAIAGKQLSRSRCRRRGKGGAAGGSSTTNMAQGQLNNLHPQHVQQAAVSAAVADTCLDDGIVSSLSMHSHNGILSPSAVSNGHTLQQQQQPQEQHLGRHNTAGKENQSPLDAESSAHMAKPEPPQKGSNDLAALQALLDDSCSSAASLLHPSLAALPYTLSAHDADVVRPGSHRSSFELGCSSYRTSVGSDVSEFQGFWLPRSSARSPFSTPCTSRTAAADPAGASPAALPTPVGLLLTATAVAQAAAAGGELLMADSLHCCNGAQGSLECLSSCDSWQAADAEESTAVDEEQLEGEAAQTATAEAVVAPCEADSTSGGTADDTIAAQQPAQQQQQQQGWDQLLLLLSLDESVSLMQVASGACNLDGGSSSGPDVSEDRNQDEDQTTADAGLQRPFGAQRPVADDVSPASPAEATSPTSGLLHSLAAGSTWGGGEESNTRYSECCPSPASPGALGSPAVLLSSPVLSSPAAAQGSEGTCRVSTRSRSVLKQHIEGGPAPGHQDDKQEPVIADGTADKQQPPNSIEFSPIRGVTLWAADAGPTGPTTWMASPSSVPLGKHLQNQQELTLKPNTPAASGNSPLWHMGQLQAAPQQQQLESGGANLRLQQLLDDSCESWKEPAAAHQQAAETAPAGDSAYSRSGLSDSPTAAELDCTTPQHTPQQQQQSHLQTGSVVAAAAGLSGDLWLQLPEHQGRRSLSPCASPLRSPAESVDSFTIAAAGDPYSSCSLSPSEKASGRGHTSGSILDHFDKGQQPGKADRSKGWCMYEGLEGMLAPGEVAPPATVICKNGWGQQVAGKAADADCSATGRPGNGLSTPQPFTADSVVVEGSSSSMGNTSPVGWQPSTGSSADDSKEVSHQLGDGEAAADVQGSDVSAAMGATAVQQLAEKLAASEAECTKHQQEAMQARQVALEKELELQVLRSALKLSEAEGSSCLDALAATIDIIAAADGSSSVTSSMELDAGVAAAVEAAALGRGTGVDPSQPESSSISSNHELMHEVQQLQEQNAALQQHNAAMQSTMAEAAQQLDILEARVSELSAEKEAAEALLSEAEQQWDQQLKRQEDFTQAELEEQQQQHEEEVRCLYTRLEGLASELQAAHKDVTDKGVSLQKLDAELVACKEKLAASQQELQQLQASLDGKASESAASTEQLQRQVQQLMAAKRELQETNARLVDAEAEYASNQQTLGCRNQELSAQVQVAQAATKQLESTVQQLQTQNSSLSQMCQALKASPPSGQLAAGGMGPATAAHSSFAAGAVGSAADAGPTPMRRRMAAANAQLERRCQELLEQKQQLTLQVQRLQEQQQGPDGEDAAASAATIQQQQVLLQELQAQVEHLSACNDELLVQLQDLDFDQQQLVEEREQLLAQIADLEHSLAVANTTGTNSSVDINSMHRPGNAARAEAETAASQQEIARLASQNQTLSLKHVELQQLLEKQQQQCEALQGQLCSAQAATAATAAQQQQELINAQTEATAAAARCQQLGGQLAAVQQQLDDTLKQRQQVEQRQSQEQELQVSHTALFERCQELEGHIQQLQNQLQLQQREHEQQMAAAAPLTSDTSSKGKSGAADHRQNLLIAELRGRLKDVLDLIEEKQQLQQQQAEQFAAKEATLNKKCRELAHELQQGQRQLSSLQAQYADQGSRLASMSSSRSLLQQKCTDLQQQLAAVDAGKAASEQAAATAAMTAVEAERAAAAAERSVAELERAIERLQGQNQGLIEQVVQLQLVDPAATAALNSSSVAVQVNLTEQTAADDGSTAKQRKRWTSELAVQVDLGATAEQAAAVQQLLLLQAQQQLQDMEQQNKQAAERLVQSKARMTELQGSIQKQQEQLRAAEQQLAQATMLHKQQTASLQGENGQLLLQLSETRKQLQLLQSANQQLEAKILQQQQELEQQQQQLTQKQQEFLQQQQKLQQQQAKIQEQSAALDSVQRQMQNLQQQQTLDKLQVATAAAELQKAKEHAQQLLQAKEKEAKELVVLQQQIQQLQLEDQQQQQVVAGSKTAAAAAAAQEAALREELGNSQQQLQVLLKEKDLLVVELQQTKVAVDFLEGSVRRLGQHNASLVQQLQDTIAAAATAAEASKANSSSLVTTRAGQQGTDASAASSAVSAHTLQQIITAATRVNEKNKRLKKQLLEMQGARG